VRVSRLLPVLVAIVVLGTTACLPADPGPDGLYLGVQDDITPVVTPKARPVTWGRAPVIDEHYGGTLYEGTGAEMEDPRPALVAGDLEPLRLWVADPDDDRTGRPAIVWLHGGGFAVGIDSMYGLASTVGRDYARRGYVGFSVEYRTDTTLVGSGVRPPSLCQWVQDNEDPDDPVWVQRRDQCARNIVAAQRDALASVRWIRRNADRFGIDPAKVAVAGFSAGAVTASNTAYQFDDVGDVRYFTGDDRSPTGSKPQAVFGASGCTYTSDGGAPATIGAGDAPVSLIHSELDPAVPYECAATTVTTARSRGLVAELTSYCGQAGHAKDLYEDHQAATDEQWTTFLARHLRLYSGMRPSSAAPVCS
jgi:predicted esterase